MAITSLLHLAEVPTDTRDLRPQAPSAARSLPQCERFWRVSYSELTKVISLKPQTTHPFHLRPEPHSLVETLNPHLPSASVMGQFGVPSGSKARVALASTTDPKDWSYRYMFEKISQRSEALDDLIDDFAETIKDAYGISELGDPHFISEEPIYTVGRILSPPTDSSKVAVSSLYLESSRLVGGGKRISLRFSSPDIMKVKGGAPGMKGFGIFPGCLVCVKGRNGGGGAFVVEEVLMVSLSHFGIAGALMYVFKPPPSALPQTSVPELVDYQHGEKLSGCPLSMMVASGPFTLDDDLSYAPLEVLVEVVLDERPDVLILVSEICFSSSLG